MCSWLWAQHTCSAGRLGLWLPIPAFCVLVSQGAEASGQTVHGALPKVLLEHTNGPGEAPLTESKLQAATLSRIPVPAIPGEVCSMPVLSVLYLAQVFPFRSFGIHNSRTSDFTKSLISHQMHQASSLLANGS